MADEQTPPVEHEDVPSEGAAPGGTEVGSGSTLPGDLAPANPETIASPSPFGVK